jgi:hypothetical protein
MVGKNLSLSKVALLGIFLTFALISMSVEAKRGVVLGGEYQNQAYEAQFNQRNSPYGIRSNLKEFSQANLKPVNTQSAAQNMQQDLQDNSAYKVSNGPHGHVIQQAPAMHHETRMHHAAPHSVVEVAPHHAHSIEAPAIYTPREVIEEVLVPVSVPITLAREREIEHNIKCHNDPNFVHDFSKMDCN